MVSSSSRVYDIEDISPQLLLVKECMCHRLSNSIARQEGQQTLIALLFQMQILFVLQLSGKSRVLNHQDTNQSQGGLPQDTLHNADSRQRHCLQSSSDNVGT